MQDMKLSDQIAGYENKDERCRTKSIGRKPGVLYQAVFRKIDDMVPDFNPQCALCDGSLRGSVVFGVFKAVFATL